MWTWETISVVLAAIVLIGNAAEKVAKAFKVAKAPGNEIREELAELQEWRKGVDRKLGSDQKELKDIHDAYQAIFQALLALLDHGIDGNNITQMEDAKKTVRNHLIRH